MIPKIIHYCWFGPGLMPKKHSDMIKQWKRIMPEYQFIKWDESNFDVHSYAYTDKAYKEGKYAFVSDVARCEALDKFGGVYLDTDVDVLEPLDAYLEEKFFTAHEIFPEFETEGKPLLNSKGLPKEADQGVPYFGLLASIIGAEKSHPIILEALRFYKDYDKDYVVIDGLLAQIATQYGYRYVDEGQELSCGATIYPTGIFGYSGAINPNYTVSYHYGLNSWRPKTKEEAREILLERYYLQGVYKFYKRIRKFVAKRILRR